MIVSGFDGLNFEMKMPIQEAKALRALLQTVDNNQNAFIGASKRMLLDGHPYTADDVQAVARQYVVCLRKLVEQLHEKPEPDESGEESKPN